MNVDKMIGEIADLDAERLKREERLKEIREKQAKTFTELGETVTKLLNLNHLLRLNDTKSYSQIIEQDGARFRLSISIPPPLTSTKEPKKRRKSRLH